MYMPLLPTQTITSVPQTPTAEPVPADSARRSLKSTAMPLGNILAMPILQLPIREPVSIRKNIWTPINCQGIQVYVRAPQHPDDLNVFTARGEYLMPPPLFSKRFCAAQQPPSDFIPRRAIKGQVALNCRVAAHSRNGHATRLQAAHPLIKRRAS